MVVVICGCVYAVENCIRLKEVAEAGLPPLSKNVFKNEIAKQEHIVPLQGIRVRQVLEGEKHVQLVNNLSAV